MIELSSLFTIIFAGLILGLTHALEADHIAAVSTLATQKSNFKDLFKLGGFWGLGHTTSIIAVGLIVLLFKIELPDSFAPILETLVGIMLIWLGVRLLKKIHQEKIHIHIHEHNGKKHSHFHSHSLNTSHHHQHRSFFIGLIHGLAGSAVLMLLVLATIDKVSLGILYLLIFGAGSTLGMAVISSLMGLPLNFFKNSQKIIQNIQLVAAIFSIYIGSTIIIEFTKQLTIYL